MAKIGTGTSLTFDYPLPAKTDQWTADIMSISMSGQAREDIDTTHLLTTIARTKIPGGLEDPGQFDLELQFDPTKPIPIDPADNIGEIKITRPLYPGEQTAANIVVNGMFTSWSWTSQTEELLAASATLKATGAPVYTPAVPTP